MTLTETEKDEFFITNIPLLHYAGLSTGTIPRKTSLKKFSNYDIQAKYKCREALLKNIDIVEEYIASNFDHLAPSQVEFLEGYKQRKEGNFIVVKCLAKHAIFLDTSDNKFYAVKALGDPFDHLLEWFPASLTNINLLPYKDKIIYDGFLAVKPIHFGGSIRRNFNDGYRQAKAEKRIITSLR